MRRRKLRAKPHHEQALNPYRDSLQHFFIHVRIPKLQYQTVSTLQIKQATRHHVNQTTHKLTMTHYRNKFSEQVRCFPLFSSHITQWPWRSSQPSPSRPPSLPPWRKRLRECRHISRQYRKIRNTARNKRRELRTSPSRLLLCHSHSCHLVQPMVASFSLWILNLHGHRIASLHRESHDGVRRTFSMPLCKQVPRNRAGSIALATGHISDGAALGVQPGRRRPQLASMP